MPTTLKKIIGLNIKTRVCVTIGCDPEFEVRNLANDRVAGDIAYRSINTSSVSHTASQIGLDGNGRTLELRPAHSLREQDVVKTIQESVERITACGYRLDVEGLYEPLGGHIHIGVSDPTVREQIKLHHVAVHLVTLFDDFLGRKILGLSGKARRDYRRLHQWRNQNWGIEYRTPPAALFHNPIMTELGMRIIRRLTEAFISAAELTYTAPPKEDDYVVLGILTKEEYCLFIKMISALRKKKKSPEPMMSLWGKAATPVKVLYKDEWASNIRQLFEIGLGAGLNHTSLNGKVVVLYGLSVNRGEVATIPVEGYGIWSHPYPTEGGRLIPIGLPYNLRMGKGDAVREKVDIALKAIIEEVKRVCA